MSGQDKPSLSLADEAEIREQALFWFTRIRSDDCSEQDVESYKNWLNADKAHQAAYLGLQELLGSVDSFEAATEIQQFREQALAGLQKRSFYRQRKWSFAIAASLILGLLVIFVAMGPQITQQVLLAFQQHQQYQTAIGEQKTITASDGSRMVLDTNSRIVTDYTRHERRVRLLQGQVRFDVAKQLSRPFIVQAGNGEVRALGTTFVVRKDNGDILVSLIEGKVEVIQQEEVTAVSPEVASSLQLEVGQQVRYSEQGLSDAVEVDIEAIEAWQQGKLIYNDASLESVIDDLNRYSRSKILLGDDSLKTIKVSGVFNSGQNDKAVRALQSYFDIKATRDKNGNLLLFSKLSTSEG